MAVGSIVKRATAGVCAILGIVIAIVGVRAYVRYRAERIDNGTLRGLPAYRLHPPDFMLLEEGMGENSGQSLFQGVGDIRWSRQTLEPTRDIAYSVRSWYRTNPAFADYRWSPGPGGAQWSMSGIGPIPNHPDYRIVVQVAIDSSNTNASLKFRPRITVGQQVIKPGDPEFGEVGAR